MRCRTLLAIVTMLAMMATASCADTMAELKAGMDEVASEFHGTLGSHGFKQTRLLNGKKCDELGLRPLQRKWGLGMTTPNEMARLLELIRDGKAGSPASCDRMMRLLSHQYWDDYIASQVPPMRAANKTGAIDGSRSDVAIVTAPAGEFVFAVYTKGQADESWSKANEGDRVIRTLAEIVWRHFDPEKTWAPPPGALDLLPSE